LDGSVREKGIILSSYGTPFPPGGKLRYIQIDDMTHQVVSGIGASKFDLFGDNTAGSLTFGEKTGFFVKSTTVGQLEEETFTIKRPLDREWFLMKAGMGFVSDGSHSQGGYTDFQVDGTNLSVSSTIFPIGTQVANVVFWGYPQGFPPWEVNIDQSLSVPVNVGLSITPLITVLAPDTNVQLTFGILVYEKRRT